MKIKFLKDYRYPGGGYNNKGDVRTFEDAEFAKWAIDNGFAEEVKESGWWKPNYGDKYYTIRPNGEYEPYFWREDIYDKCFQAIGNVFKTRESAQRFINYLKAVETVRHDEGFMKISRKIDHAPYGYAIVHSHWSESLVAEHVDSANYAGKFYFDTEENAQASIEKHRDEWRTILDYDWSKE